MRFSAGSRKFAIALALFGVCATPAISDESPWLKLHRKVEFDGTLFGEYTVIRTRKSENPMRERILYKDEQGVLLVIRIDTPYELANGLAVATSTTTSITKADTGEQVRIEMPHSGSVTLGVGTASMTTEEDYETVPATVRTQAIAMLNANSSQGFRDALRRFALVGKRHAPDFESLGFVLCAYYFPCMATSSVNYTTHPTDVIKNFDPAIHPPGPFEEPFGTAWAE